MKWWYVVVLLAGAGVGWWMLGKYQTKKIIAPATVTSRIERETGPLPSQTTSDLAGSKVATVELTGIVQKWHPDTGLVEFLREGKLLNLTVDPAGTVIFVPSRKVKDKEIKIVAKGNIQWQTAFRRGDS